MMMMMMMMMMKVLLRAGRRWTADVKRQEAEKMINCLNLSLSLKTPDRSLYKYVLDGLLGQQVYQAGLVE